VIERGRERGGREVGRRVGGGERGRREEEIRGEREGDRGGMEGARERERERERGGGGGRTNKENHECTWFEMCTFSRASTSDMNSINKIKINCELEYICSKQI